MHNEDNKKQQNPQRPGFDKQTPGNKDKQKPNQGSPNAGKWNDEKRG